MSKNLSPMQAVRRLAFVEKMLAPAIERATVEHQQVAATERTKILAERAAEVTAREQAAASAWSKQREADARANKARGAFLAAEDAARDATIEALGAENEAARSRATYDRRLAELGSRTLDETVHKLKAMSVHARMSATYFLPAKLGREGFPTVGAPLARSPINLAAAQACDATVAELEKLRYDPGVTPDEIEARCAAAIERCLAIGDPSFWGEFMYPAPDVDMGEFRRWIARTTDDPEVRTRLTAEH